MVPASCFRSLLSEGENDVAARSPHFAGTGRRNRFTESGAASDRKQAIFSAGQNVISVR
jgi:hypothetical protein